MKNPASLPLNGPRIAHSLSGPTIVTFLIVLVTACPTSAKAIAASTDDVTPLVHHQPARVTDGAEQTAAAAAIVGPTKRVDGMPDLLTDRGLHNPLTSASRLLFRIDWWKIHTGFAELTIRPAVGPDVPAHGIAIEIHAWTTPFFSTFFTVDDRISTVIDSRTFLPLRYHESIREGSYRRERTCTFIHEQHRAVIDDKNYAISSSSLCPLSAFTIMRLLRMGTDSPVSLDVFANNHGYQLECAIDKLETLSTELGSFLCLQLTPVLSLRGKKLEENSQLRLWFSADEHRFPIRLETNVKVGTLSATLIAIDPSDEDVQRAVRKER